MLRALLLTVALLGLAAPAAALSPATVVDLVAVPVSPTDVLLAWTPSPEPALYEVYGILAGGALAPLGSTTDEQMIVPAGYAGYAVAVVVDGETVEWKSTGGYCVGAYGIPPTITIGQCKNGLLSLRNF